MDTINSLRTRVSSYFERLADYMDNIIPRAITVISKAPAGRRFIVWADIFVKENGVFIEHLIGFDLIYTSLLLYKKYGHESSGIAAQFPHLGTLLAAAYMYTCLSYWENSDGISLGDERLPAAILKMEISSDGTLGFFMMWACGNFNNYLIEMFIAFIIFHIGTRDWIRVSDKFAQLDSQAESTVLLTEGAGSSDAAFQEDINDEIVKSEADDESEVDDESEADDESETDDEIAYLEEELDQAQDEIATLESKLDTATIRASLLVEACSNKAEETANLENERAQLSKQILDHEQTISKDKANIKSLLDRDVKMQQARDSTVQALQLKIASYERIMYGLDKQILDLTKKAVSREEAISALAQRNEVLQSNTTVIQERYNSVVTQIQAAHKEQVQKTLALEREVQAQHSFNAVLVRKFESANRGLAMKNDIIRHVSEKHEAAEKELAAKSEAIEALAAKIAAVEEKHVVLKKCIDQDQSALPVGTEEGEDEISAPSGHANEDEAETSAPVEDEDENEDNGEYTDSSYESEFDMSDEGEYEMVEENPDSN